MLAASTLAVNFSAQDFLQASDELERVLTVELATGALNFTVLGVSDLEATLEFVADARTTTLSAPAIDEAGTNVALPAVVALVCVVISRHNRHSPRSAQPKAGLPGVSPRAAF